MFDSSFFVAISFLKDRASTIRLLIFSSQTFLLVAWFWALIGLTPVGITFFVEVFGTSTDVAKEAQLCILISTLIVPCVFFRSIAYALLMLNRRTTLVTLGTLIRLFGLFAILFVLQGQTTGATVGMIALTGCIAIESVYATLAALKYYLQLPSKKGALPRYRELWRFGWPVILMQTAESGIAFTISFFLGRLPRPELAIAAFGVLDAMIRVLLGPLRNLTQAVQTLTKNEADTKVISTFTIHLGIIFSVIMLMFHIDIVRNYALKDIMGLSSSLTSYVTPALLLTPILALSMTTAAFTRGQLLASRKTTAIALASVIRIVSVCLVGVGALVFYNANGAVVGILALITAFSSETIILGGRVIYAVKVKGGLFN